MRGAFSLRPLEVNMSRRLIENLASFPWGECACSQVRRALTFWVVCSLFSEGASAYALAKTFVDLGFAREPVATVERAISQLLPQLAALKHRRRIIGGCDGLWRATLAA